MALVVFQYMGGLACTDDRSYIDAELVLEDRADCREADEALLVEQGQGEPVRAFWLGANDSRVRVV